MRNTFKQDKTAKRINMMMRGIISFVIVAIIVIFFVFIFAFLIPYLRAEFSPDSLSESSLDTGTEFSEMMQYDAKGLPIYSNDISLFIINSKNPADVDYVPKTENVSGIKVNSDIATALKMLVSNAKDAGLLLEFTDGYISYEEQKLLYEAKVEELVVNGQTRVMAAINAKEYVPAAGESDFQTGLCIRLNADPETFTSSRTYEWLNQNMADYGFVFRFPSGSTKATGVNDKENSNVIRYVGSENASSMRALSMNLEDYIAYLNSR